MRVTPASTNRRYLEHLNVSMAKMNEISFQISSGRKFSRASEDTVSATKALLVRREYDKTQVFISNTEDATDILSATESALTQVNKIMIDVIGLVTTAINGSNEGQPRDVIANNIRNLSEEILKVANTEFAGKYVMGGSAGGTPPFTKGPNGQLLFNGAPVSQNAPDGRPYSKSELENAFPENKGVYVDVGMGLQISADGKINPEHALKISTSGVEVLGSGVDGEGYPKNVYELIQRAATMIDSDSFTADQGSKMLNKLIAARDNIGLEITNIGDRQASAKTNLTRLKNDDLNLMKTMNRLESVDKESAIIDYKMHEFIYKSTLQMGTKIIQPSLFDYMR